jgi:TolA-binding protein
MGHAGPWSAREASPLPGTQEFQGRSRSHSSGPEFPGTASAAANTPNNIDGLRTALLNQTTQQALELRREMETQLTQLRDSLNTTQQFNDQLTQIQHIRTALEDIRQTVQTLTHEQGTIGEKLRSMGTQLEQKIEDNRDFIIAALGDDQQAPTSGAQQSRAGSQPTPLQVPEQAQRQIAKALWVGGWRLSGEPI